MGYPFNQLEFGIENESITTVIEISKGSATKIEWHRKDEYFVVDRIEPHIFAKPCNYGFIPQTLDDDGDELDTLVITDEPIPMGAVVKEARVIGVLNFEDDGEMDHKIICVPADDRHNAKLMHHEELGEAWHQQIEHHFTHYKDLKKKGTTTVHGFGTVEDAWKIINECRERAQANRWW
jgi:inorganic pyrophosphatase